MNIITIMTCQYCGWTFVFQNGVLCPSCQQMTRP
jgi:rubrerythrin